MAQVFFILGHGRSSTGLLARLLARHPALVIAPDSLFVLDFYRRYGKQLSRRRVAAFCRDAVRAPGLVAFHLEQAALSRRLGELPSMPSYAELCRAVYTSYAEDTLGRRGVRFVGDADPWNAIQIDRLDRAFEGARYVHVTRDCRDEICERFRAKPGIALRGGRRGRSARAGHGSYAHRWFEHPAALAERWREHNERILTLTRRAPERSLWLRHEDLLAYPEHELARVCRFLDIPFDAGLLAPSALLPSSGAGAPLSHAPIASSFAPLDASALRDIDAVSGAFGERFGYRPTTRGRKARSVQAVLWSWCGASTVAAERLIVQVFPARVRRGLRALYLRFEAALSGDDGSTEVLP